MAKKRVKSVPTERVRLTAEESLKRVQEFAKRKEHFVAAVLHDRCRPTAGECKEEKIK
jgi:hypothetical protein